jgi:hypothetical protein
LKKISNEDAAAVPEYGLSRAEDLSRRSGLENIHAAGVGSLFRRNNARAGKTAEDAGVSTLVRTVKRMLGMGEAPLIVKGHDDPLVFRPSAATRFR